MIEIFLEKNASTLREFVRVLAVVLAALADSFPAFSVR
jgi:hypothetical protein